MSSKERVAARMLQPGGIALRAQAFVRALGATIEAKQESPKPKTPKKRQPLNPKPFKP